MEALHKQEGQLVAEKAAGESSGAALKKSYFALQAERDSLQEKLTVQTPPGSYRDVLNFTGNPQIPIVLQVYVAQWMHLWESRVRLESRAGKPWLTIGIPTIPRKNQTDYLTRTLSSLMEEVPLDPTDPMYRQVQVIVMNNRPGAHPVWEQARISALHSIQIVTVLELVASVMRQIASILHCAQLCVQRSEATLE